MATYKGKSAVIERPIGDLYGRFSDMSALEEAVKARPEAQEHMAEMKFDADSLTIVTPQVGEIRFEIVERVEPSRIVFKATSSPLPLGMTINLKAVDETVTEVSTSIDIELPVMVRALVGPKLQHVADQFGDMMAKMGK